MKTISHHRSGIDPPSTVPQKVHFVYWGAVIGLFAGLATLFTVSTAYGAASGLAPANCAALGGVTTLLLSQPIGLAGILVGAACGALWALVAHRVHWSRR